MFPEIDAFRQLLLSLPLHTSHPSLTTAVRILADFGHLTQAISHFRSIRTHFLAYPPSLSLYNFLMESCLRENSVGYISWLYDDLIIAGHSPETYTFNLLIGGLCDCDRLEDARKLFDKMRDKGCQPNEFSFGILIRGYCRAGLASTGLELLDVLKNMGLSPNAVIYNTLISTFCKESKTDEVEKLVERMRKDDLLPDVVTFNSRISALCSAGKIIEASRIFRDMQLDDELGLPRPNIITYNLMLEGFCKKGMLEEAKTLVESMKINGAFTKVESYNIWLMGLLGNGKVVEAQSVLKEMAEIGIRLNVYSYNIMMDGLCKKGMLTDARLMLYSMKRSQVPPDTVTYSTLLHAYCTKGRVLEANNVLICGKRGNYQKQSLLQKMKEKGFGVDTVTCNIVIDGLCKCGKVDKAVGIVSEMWDHGSAALGDLDNSFIDLLDDNSKWKDCMPDLITYSTVINGLCNAGRLDEAKRKFADMTERNLYLDSIVYDTFIHSFCKIGKVSSAFRVLKDMERKGFNKSLQTYNSLIVGLGSKNQIFEMYGLMDEMRERGVSPDVFTYNSEFGIAREVFDIALTTCGHKVSLYSLMFNELLAEGEILEAKALLEASLDRCFDIESFLYKDLINRLLIDGLGKRGIKHETDELAERMLEMASHGNVTNKVYRNKRELSRVKPGKYGGSDWQAIVHRAIEPTGDDHKVLYCSIYTAPCFHFLELADITCISLTMDRDDGSGIALKTLKRVQKGWDQGSTLSLQP
ncbi:hypothetical protein RHSIM_Rhsim11G0197400 [Rhododendron simsii]|uniref:Pentatricopeptide repeat-containing protein n=1 Tax=Rhododendron simsii TaxID=118357 RepID=A0A834GD32_RHOSS|nr:hypothetical protein RHSIM_Rhsim11G0197400 [Rhododendron simsii]